MFLRKIYLFLGLIIACNSASADTQVFKSAFTPGHMNEHFRVKVTRDCQNINDALKCKKQDITISDSNNVIYGKYDSSKIPKNPDGTHKINLANILLINEDDGGGDSSIYFFLRFIPQDKSDTVTLPNLQIYPNYYDVILDSGLNPLKGMKISSDNKAMNWLNKKQDDSNKKFKRNLIEQPLGVEEYVTIMPER